MENKESVLNDVAEQYAAAEDHFADQPENQPENQHSVAKVQQSPKHLEVILQAISDTLDGQPLTKLNLLRVVAACMSVTAKINVAPRDKKKLLIQAVKQYLNNANDITEEEKELLLLLAQEILDSAIDLFSDIKKGKLLNNSCCIII
jgi:hypothetical protein